MSKPYCLIVSCEHGGNRVPKPYNDLFRGSSRLLRSHRGFDAGSLFIARKLAARLNVPLHASEISRLLVDLNRSPRHRNLFSEFSRKLPDSGKNRILETFYRPYRKRIETEIGHLISTGSRVVHISVHSFVPSLDGTVRTTDIGYLYDPRREPEKEFCRRWRDVLKQTNASLRIRCNYPYLGKADGLTTWLRRRFTAPADYLGIELELNQRLLRPGTPSRMKALSERLGDSLSRTWEGWKDRHD